MLAIQALSGIGSSAIAMKDLLRCALFLSLVFFFGRCRSEEPASQRSEKKTPAVVDALAVRAKSVAQVDSLLGEPADSSFIEQPAPFDPFQVRRYASDFAEAKVHFFEGAVAILIVEYAASDTNSIDEALQVVGLNENMLEPVHKEAPHSPLREAPQRGLRLVLVSPGERKGWRRVDVWYEDYFVQ